MELRVMKTFGGVLALAVMMGAGGCKHKSADKVEYVKGPGFRADAVPKFKVRCISAQKAKDVRESKEATPDRAAQIDQFCQCTSSEASTKLSDDEFYDMLTKGSKGVAPEAKARFDAGTAACKVKVYGS